nr:unnamed protein product [Digitaria exilis]
MLFLQCPLHPGNWQTLLPESRSRHGIPLHLLPPHLMGTLLTGRPQPSGSHADQHLREPPPNRPVLAPADQLREPGLKEKLSIGTGGRDKDESVRTEERERKRAHTAPNGFAGLIGSCCCLLAFFLLHLRSGQPRRWLDCSPGRRLPAAGDEARRCDLEKRTCERNRRRQSGRVGKCYQRQSRPSSTTEHLEAAAITGHRSTADPHAGDFSIDEDRQDEKLVLPDDVLLAILSRLAPRSLATSPTPAAFCPETSCPYDFAEFLSRPSAKSVNYPPYMCVRDHCNGLLLLDDCVLNPVTGRRTPFPECPSTAIVMALVPLRPKCLLVEDRVMAEEIL